MKKGREPDKLVNGMQLVDLGKPDNNFSLLIFDKPTGERVLKITNTAHVHPTSIIIPFNPRTIDRIINALKFLIDTTKE